VGPRAVMEFDPLPFRKADGMLTVSTCSKMYSSHLI